MRSVDAFTGFHQSAEGKNVRLSLVTQLTLGAQAWLLIIGPVLDEEYGAKVQSVIEHRAGGTSGIAL